MSKRLLAVDDLTAGYGRLAVVRQMNIAVDEGQVVALFGANGAGKTTTALTIGSLLSPLDGTIEVLGLPVRGGRRAHEAVRRGLGLVPDDRGLFPPLTVRQHLRLAAGRHHETRWIFDELPELSDHLDQKAGSLSGGEQQMLAIARALVPRPRLLVIDEMSMGLAPLVAARLGRVVRRMATEHGVGVLLIEQHASLALSLADQAVVLAHGRTTFSGPAAELRDQAEMLESAYLGVAAAPSNGTNPPHGLT